MSRVRLIATFGVLVALLGVVAWAAPKPWFITDADMYEGVARSFILPDCSDLQCFRPLAPWILGRIPGTPLLVWKAYAVVATAAAAIALARVCLLFGLTAHAAELAAWMLAFSFGPLLTLFNPYGADPLMYLVGPLVVAELLRDRRALAGLLAGVGVFGKEVAAAPLWIGVVWALLRRRWELAVRLFAIALGVTLVWVGLQLWLMLRYNYSYAGSGSADLLHGGDLRIWLGVMGPGHAAGVLLSTFGGLFLLVPVGYRRASEDLKRFALAAVPAALALTYVQQPDRSLWNFHYAMLPLAAIALEALPAFLAWLFVACYAASNLRVGANLPRVPSARYALAASIAIAAFAAVKARRS